jgi:hypothetical protein
MKHMAKVREGSVPDRERVKVFPRGSHSEVQRDNMDRQGDGYVKGVCV